MKLRPGSVVGVITTSFPRHPGDHAGTFVADRVRCLLRTGAHVDVIAAGEPSQDETAVPGARVTRIGPEIPGRASLFGGIGAPEAIESARGYERAFVALQAAAVSARLLSAVRDRVDRWDALESHWLVPCGVVAALAAGGRSHRAWAHSGDVALMERMPAGRGTARWLAGSGASLTFVSEDLRTRFARLAGSVPASQSWKVETPGLLGATFERSVPPGPAAGTGRDAPWVLAVGRLVPIKGFDLLVRAVGHLPRGFRPDVVVLGDGPERERLARLAVRCDVRLHLPGYVPRQAVAHHLATARLCVLPSRVLPNGRREGLPTVAREAMAIGTPLVATAAGGLGELRAQPGVTLVDAGDLDALTRAVERAFLPNVRVSTV